MKIGDGHVCVFGIFRMLDGLIVEHLDVIEKNVAPGHWNNQVRLEVTRS